MVTNQIGNKPPVPPITYGIVEDRSAIGRFLKIQKTPINIITENALSHNEYQATTGICRFCAGLRKLIPNKLSFSSANENGLESPYHFPAMFFNGAVKTPLALIVELLKLDLETEKLDWVLLKK